MKKTIAVIFGGKSVEHDISIVTAIAAVIKPLQLLDEYTVVPVYIAKNGAWYSSSRLMDILLYQTSAIDDFCANTKPITVQFNGGLMLKTPGVRGKNIRIDIAFPAMHGTNGEDGALMGLLKMADIPFVGCDMQASVIAMDKILTKQVAQMHGITVANYQWIYGRELAKNPKQTITAIEASLKYPLFVKPAHLGSSIGLSRVNNYQELYSALEIAAYYDNKILVEEAVNNLIEVTVPLMGNDTIETAMVERPLVADGVVFDFVTKYTKGGKKAGGQKGAQGYSEIPATIPAKLYSESLRVARAMYTAVECEGTARVDLLIDSKAGVVYLNEINPLPGSLYAHNWRAAGVSQVALVAKLVTLALERHKRQQTVQNTFTTNFLQQF